MTRNELLSLILAYAIGCICSGYYLLRWRTGEDLRQLGSGSLGGTNAARQLGAWAMPLVVALDLGKGLLALLLARRLGVSDPVLALAAGSVVLGHILPVQLGFKGGKGVATSIGAWVVAAPWALGLLALVALSGILLTRRLVPAGMLGYAAIAIGAWPLSGEPALAASLGMTSFLVIYAHRDNLRRELGRGREGASP